jgi:hypothetical protein
MNQNLSHRSCCCEDRHQRSSNVSCGNLSGRSESCRKNKLTRWPVDTETGQVNCQLSILKSALLGPYLREEWAKPLSPSLFRQGARGSQRLPWLEISMPPVSRAYLAKSNGHRRVDGSSASPKWTARNGLRSTTRGTRSSRDKASFSIAWNKSCGRCHRSEGRLYPSSSG